MRKLALIASLLLLAPGVAQAKSLEDLLVEKGVITKGEAQAHSDGSKFYWDDGTRIEFAETGFSVKINTQLQTRYEFVDGDSDFGLGNTSSFEVNRAKLVVSGHVVNRQFSYMLEASFQGQADTLSREELSIGGVSRAPELHDAYITWAPCDNGHLKLGQFKPKAARSWNTHSAKMQFPDRSFVGLNFAFRRQGGLEGQWGFADNRFKVGGQAFNGLSDGEGINASGQDTNHMGVLYARANIMGELDPYAEGDIDMTEEAAWDVGFAYLYGEQNNPSIPAFADTQLQVVTADTNFKYQGWGLHGEFYWQDIEEDTGPAVNVSPVGASLQAGYFLSPKKLELALRYGFLDCDGGGAIAGVCSGAGVDDVNEASVSLNYFWWEHHLKAQVAFEFIDYDLASPIRTSEEDLQTNRWLVQLSSWF